jgi:glycosyltransferase involved in cell wall biosynthesis
MSLPLVSIIIPFYNKKNTINRSVDSVLNQTYTNWELIIVDDCGEEKIENHKLPQDDRIKVLFNESNRGAAQTRQRGLENSSGEYVAFLDADDWWDENFLQTTIDAFNSCNKIDGVYVQSVLLDDAGNQSLREYCDIGLEKIRETLIEYKRPWQTGGILWRKNSCGSWGDLLNQEDSWFEIKSSKYNKFLCIKKPYYFVDRSNIGRLSNRYSKSVELLNQQKVLLLLYDDYFNLLELKYKFLLVKRILNNHLKLHKTLFSPNEHVQKYFGNRMFFNVLTSNFFTLKCVYFVLRAIGPKYKM